MKNFNNSNKHIAVKSLAIGVAVGIVAISLMLLITSFSFAQIKSIPTAMLGTISMIFASLGACIGAYVSLRIMRNNGLVWGAICGAVLFVIVLILGLINSTDSLSIATIIKCFAMLLSGAIGGVVAVNKKQKIKY